MAWLLFRTWATARIKGDVDAQYAKELEVHRAELRARTDTELEQFRRVLEQDRAVQAVATGAFAAAHGAAAERRLNAVQEIWDAVLRTREVAGRLMLLLDIHTREELAAALDDPKRDESIGNPTDKAMMEEFHPAGATVERVRPFIDESLWALVFGYRALIGRIVVLLKKGREAGQLRFWLDDKHTKAMLRSLVDDAEFLRVEKMKIGGIGEAQRMIERRIVEAARRTVSGEASSDAALARAKVVLERAREAYDAEA